MPQGWQRYWATYVVIGAGVALRVAMFVAMPPRLAYDNHYRVIELMRAGHRLPRPDECWECYQPPLYYVVASGVYSAAGAMSSGDSAAATASARKAVQGISLVAGCCTLFFCLAILRRVCPCDPFTEAVCLGAVAVLPQHLFMSAMATNDATCYLLATVAIWGTVRLLEAWAWKWVIVSATFAGASVLCKGYGWVTVGAVGLVLAVQAARGMSRGAKFAAWGVVALLIAAGPSIRNLQIYGRVHVDNFDFITNPMANQPPGKIDRVEFATFRLLSLIEHPWLHVSQCASFWTNLYARHWFDFEGLSLTLAEAPEWRAYRKSLPPAARPPSLDDWNRLLDWPASAVPDELRKVAVTSYVAGLPISAAVCAGLLLVFVRGREAKLWLIVGHQIACLCVPVFQTIRLPVFSAMKAAFTLSAISSAAVLAAFCVQRLPGRWATIVRVIMSACLVVVAVGAMALTGWFYRHAA